VLRVFLGADGGGGNPLGVFIDGGAIEPGRRQALAAELGYSETVFVDAIDGDVARVAIFTPAAELGFAGHPTIGTAWLLQQLGRAVGTVAVRAGDVGTWSEGDLTWIRARPAWVHPIEMPQLTSAAEIDALTGPEPGQTSWYPWAWIDEPAGVLRSRYFFSGAGIGEDEATGAAAVLIGGRLGRPLLIRQGAGSELHVRPGPEGSVEVGGRCRLLEERPFALGA
jgi:predicted PhzF superfamily epimerase YddE/YHI9